MKQEIQLQQKSKSLLYVCKIYATRVLSTMCTGENLVTEATDVKPEANNEPKCKSLLFHAIKRYLLYMHAGENSAPTALDNMSHESRDQHDEIKVKTLSQLQKDESEKQERIDNMFMNLRSAETV